MFVTIIAYYHHISALMLKNSSLKNLNSKLFQTSMTFYDTLKNVLIVFAHTIEVKRVQNNFGPHSLLLYGHKSSDILCHKIKKCVQVLNDMSE